MAKTRHVALHFNMARVHQQGIVRGIIDYAAIRGWKLYGSFWTLDSVKDLRRWQGDGVIAAVEDKKTARILQRSGLPTVDIADAMAGTNFSLVTNANAETGCLGWQHLRETGLERFAFCGIEDTVWSAKRLAGFNRAAAAGTMKPFVFTRPASWWQAGGQPRELIGFLRKLPKPAGIMAANDTVGVKITGACREARILVPDEVAVVGVDNEDILCQLAATHLSSIPFDRREIGFRAAERLDALMRGLLPTMPHLEIPPLPVVARASSEVVLANDSLVRKAIALIRDREGRVDAGFVASTVHASRRNLERRFKADTGKTLLEIIHQTRINHAKRLLRETELPLAKVAVRSGFHSPLRFNAVFKLHIGVMPAQYRKKQGIMQK